MLSATNNYMSFEERLRSLELLSFDSTHFEIDMITTHKICIKLLTYQWMMPDYVYVIAWRKKMTDG